MAEKGDQKVSILLDGGIADRRAIELRGSVVQQLASPALARADNVRLSITRGVPERAPGMQTIVTGLPDECHGIIPGGAGNTTLVLFRGKKSIVLRDTSIAQPYLATSPTGTALGVRGTCFIPGHVVRGSGISPGYTLAAPICALDEDTGNVWHMVIADVGGVSGVRSILIEDGDGNTLTGPLAVPMPAAATITAWSALTSHGANRMAWWYYVPGTGLRFTFITFDPSSGALDVSFIAATDVLLPANDLQVDVRRLDSYRVVIYGGSSSVAANSALVVYNVDTASGTTIAIASPGATSTYSVIAAQYRGSTWIACAATGSTGPSIYVTLLNSSLSIVWNVTTALGAVGRPDEVAIGFYIMPGELGHVVVAASKTTGEFSTPSSDPICTKFYAYSVADGSSAFLYDYIKPWKRPVAKAGQLRFSDAELVPLFPLVTMLSESVADASDDVQYVDDPCLELWQFGILFAGSILSEMVAPSARLGVVRGSVSPARVAVTGTIVSSTFFAVKNGRSVVLGYQSQAQLGATGTYRVTISEVDYSPRQLITAADSNGSAMVACALPMNWDGNELAELGAPTSRPHLRDSGFTTTGSWAAGTYFAFAYQRWKDASGNTIRTRISNVVTVSLPGGSAPVLYASLSSPMTRRLAITFGTCETILAATPLNSPGFNEIASQTIESITDGTVQLLRAGPPQLYDPVAYSDGALGSELMPSPPPPLCDIAIVSGRAWGIDAEYRFRAVYSKLRVVGGAYEFNPALEIVFPRTGGELVRIFEVSGVPVVLAERAVWLVSGSGPDNTGANGSFAAPMKVSDFGCTDPYSAQSFPGGIVWSGKGRWYILSGSTVMQVSDVNAEMNFLCSVGMRDQDEIVFYGTELSSDPTVGETTDAVFMTDLDGSFMTDLDGSFIVESESTTAVTTSGGDTVAKVYNYILNRWTRWVSPVARAFTQAANSPNEFRRHIGFQQNALVVVDGESYAANAPMVLETDWMILGGDFQDHVIVRDIIFNAERHSDHDVTIEAFTNYKLTATTSRSYSPSVIASVVAEQGSDPRYSLRVEPAEQETRAVKIRLTITVTGSDVGCRPISLTILFAVFAPVREESFSKALGGFQ